MIENAEPVPPPDMERFMAWAKEMDFPIKNWTINNQVQFFTFFRKGWECREMEIPTSPCERN